MTVKESKHNLFTGQRAGQDIEHKLAAGAAYCAEDTHFYRGQGCVPGGKVCVSKVYTAPISAPKDFTVLAWDPQSGLVVGKYAPDGTWGVLAEQQIGPTKGQ